jgi:hypothetical protein
MKSKLSQRFYDALGASQFTLGQLWLSYFALGGEADQFEVDAYLNGVMALPPLQHDILAHAINERLDEIAPPRAPYSDDSTVCDDGGGDWSAPL